MVYYISLLLLLSSGSGGSSSSSSSSSSSCIILLREICGAAPEPFPGLRPPLDAGIAANLRTKTLDFEGFDSSRIFKGWNSHVDREFLGKFESTNVSRDNLSREIGRGHLRTPRTTPSSCAAGSCRTARLLICIYIYIYI